MDLFSERRLICLRASDFNDPTRYNRRVAQANADTQQRVPQSQPAEDPNNPLSDSERAAQRFIQPGVNAPVDYVPTGGQPDPESQRILDQARANTGDTYSYDPKTGKVSTPPPPAPNSPVDGLSGPTAELAARRRQERLDATPAGTTGIQDLLDMGVGSFEDLVARGLQQVDGVYYTPDGQGGFTKLPSDIIDQYKNLNQQKQQDQDQSRKTKAATEERGLAQLKADNSAALNSSIRKSSLGMLAAGLPPEYAFITESMQEGIDALDQAGGDLVSGFMKNDQVLRDLQSGQRSYFDAVLENFRKDKTSSQELLKVVRDEQQSRIAQEQETLIAQSKFEEDRTVRQARNAKAQLVERMTTSLALEGGYGSSNGNKEIADAEYEAEQNIIDLQKEFGFKRMDISTKLTQAFNDANLEFMKGMLQIGKEYTQQEATLTLQGAGMDQEVELRRAANVEKLYAGIAELRLKKADTIRQAGSQVMDAILTERKFKADAEARAYDQRWEQFKFTMQQQIQREEFGLRQSESVANKAVQADTKAKDRFDRASNTISDNARQDPVLKDYNTAKTMYQQLQGAYEESQRAGNLIGADQALIQMFNKMLDPTSVVREAEYARTPENAPAFNRIIGKWQQIKNGGAGLSNGDREAIKRMSDEFMRKYDARFQDVSQRYYLQMDAYNRTAPMEYQLSPGMLGLPSSTHSGQRSILDQLAPAGLFPALGGAGGGMETVGDALLSFGQVTQDFDTVAKSKAEGGLYEESTVRAWGGKHAGIDLKMPTGTSLPSFVDGTVESFGSEPGWGKTLVIRDSNGALHRLSHLSGFPPDLKKGQPVARGQVVGFSGNSGNSTGPHLDYRIKVNGKYVDPLTYTG